jgi:ketosteroid isomerase-like protein
LEAALAAARLTVPRGLAPMRRASALGELAMVESVRSRLFDFFTAYAEGRLDQVLREFDDNVVMTCYAPVDVFPYFGRKQGKAAVAAAMRAKRGEFEYLAYQPVFTVAEPQNAAVIILARLRQRASDRMIQLFIATFISFDKGLIVEIRKYMDSFDAVQQVLGRELVVPQKPH